MHFRGDKSGREDEAIQAYKNGEIPFLTSKNSRPYVDDRLLFALERYAQDHLCRDFSGAVNQVLAEALRPYLSPTKGPTTTEPTPKQDALKTPIVQDVPVDIPTQIFEPVRGEHPKQNINPDELIGDILGEFDLVDFE